jgi:hypothetical protein
MYYHDKYLKYKNKYLKLKSEMNLTINNKIGGETPIIEDLNFFNFIDNNEIESYLNPIYGLIMSKNGYIENIFFLDQINLIEKKNNPFIRPINKIFDPVLMRPGKIILELKPIEFGRHLALKYIYNNFGKKNVYKFYNYYNGNITINFGSDDEKKNDSETIIKFIKNDKVKSKTTISYDKDDKIFYHLILYCLWYVLDNKAGMTKYYEGISEVFDIFNKYLPDDKKLILHNTDSFNKNILFYNTISILTIEHFKIYKTGNSKTFCLTSNTNTYTDCGEVVIRNFINLLCYNGRIFDINELKKFCPIKELIDYYKIFYNFKKQSDDENKHMIYDENLNARDAWSKLIIKYGNQNKKIKFSGLCKNNSQNYGFNIDTGLSNDEKTSNLFQLIKNLLPMVKEWDDIKNNNIVNIIDETNKGNGKIIVKHKKLGQLIIYISNIGHYDSIFKNSNKSNFDDDYDDDGYSDDEDEDEDINTIKINFDAYSNEQQNILNILLKKKINMDNYLWIKFNKKILIEMFNKYKNDDKFKILLLKLSLTKLYDEDNTREEITNNLSSNIFSDYFNDLLNKLNNDLKKKLENYIYKSKDFEFIKNMSFMEKLNFNIIKSDIEQIDLSPLYNIKYIGNHFLQNYWLQEINLKPLLNLQTIGDNFMTFSKHLENIDFQSLKNLKKIGNNFLSDCEKLKDVNLLGLENLEVIGDNFLEKNINLKEIDLSSSKCIRSIGSDFLSGCKNIEQINLPKLSSFETIRNNFMYNCKNIKNIDFFTESSNIKSIGDNFLYGCKNIENINLSGLVNIESFGYNFLSGCENIKNINLSGLIKLKSIGDHFLSGCENLENINLSGLVNLKSIENYFLYHCFNLKEINLSGLTNLEKIGDNFLNINVNFYGRRFVNKNIKEINLLSLESIKTIGNDFLRDLTSINKIYLPPLKNLESIEDNFLYNCTNIENIEFIELTKINYIGPNFLGKCEKITNINLLGLNSIESIGSGFLSDCKKLKTVNLSGITNVEIIENNFLSDCENLESINLSGITNVEIIGNNFLLNCKNLETVDLSGLENLKKTGNNFLSGCEKLKSINLIKFNKLTSVGNNFMYNCPLKNQINL